jgi:predicted transcriptional regulator
MKALTKKVTELKADKTLCRWQKLKEIAARQKCSAHALATEAIITLIEQKERDYAFNQSCIDSYNQYQKTGLHVTHEELVPWMDSLFTDNELLPPKSHV